MNFVDRAINKFAEKKPMAVMARVLITNTLSSETFDRVYSKHRKRQFEGDLSFSTVADIMGEVVLKIHPKVNSAYVNRQIDVSVNSVYNKLQGIETQVSRAVVKETASKMMSIVDNLSGPLPPLLLGYRTKIVDGNHFRRTDRRIGELRELNVAPLPGQALVVYDPQYKMAIDVLPCECGHASERTLLPELLETIEKNDLMIMDRNFCAIHFLFGLVDAQAKFIIRQHGQMPYQLKGHPRRIGEIETGIVYEQRLECEDQSGNRKHFRRVTIHLFESTRDGDFEIHLITNLPKGVSSLKVAELYRNRWQIETAFQNMAENLQGEIETLGYPKAALFSFCMALVALNLFSVIRSTVEKVHGEEAAQNLSIYYVTNEIKSASEGMAVIIENTDWTKKYASMTPAQIAKELQWIAKSINLKKYKKNKWTPKNNDKLKQDKTNRQHASTFKILQASRCDT